jgi:hypothetical protein
MANPYPGFAAMLIAGLDGAKNKLARTMGLKQWRSRWRAFYFAADRLCANNCLPPTRRLGYFRCSQFGWDGHRFYPYSASSRSRIDGPAHCNDFKYRARLAGAPQASLAGL